MSPLKRFSKAYSLALVFLLAAAIPAAQGEDVEVEAQGWKVRLAAYRSMPAANRADAAKTWAEMLDDKDFGINTWALDHFPAEAAPDLVGRLTALALTSRIQPLRVRASAILGKLAPAELLKACREAVEGNADRQKVYYALDALGYLRTDEGAAIIGDLLRNSVDTTLITKALRVLQRSPDIRGFALLKGIAEGKFAPALRIQAIGSLGSFRMIESVDFLISLLAEQDLEIVDAAWTALQAATGKSFLPAHDVWKNWWKGERETFAWPPEVNIPPMLTETVEPARLDAAIDLAGDWLISVQDDDGRFDSLNYGKHFEGVDVGAGRIKTDICMTGLAALAFISAGIKGEDAASKKRAAACEKAMAWLVKQPPTPGNYRTDNIVTYVHEQGVATWALAEYVAAGHADYGRFAAEAFAKCMEYRDSDLSWGYPNMPGNTSNSCVTVWYGCAFAAGRQAGMDLPRTGFEGIADWFDRATEEFSGFVCCIPVKEPTPAMTGVGLLCKGQLDWDMKSTVNRRSAALILARPIATSSFYDLYYYGLGLAQMEMHEAAAYNTRIIAHLVDTQDRSGSPRRGSWDARSDIWESSRIYTATMAIPVLALYRGNLACMKKPVE